MTASAISYIYQIIDSHSTQTALHPNSIGELNPKTIVILAIPYQHSHNDNLAFANENPIGLLDY